MNNTFKVVTYNIDGLPDSLDLNELPLLLKPIAWIYKLIYKTTVIKINDNDNTSSNISKISQYLFGLKPNIIGVQEDFNYHDELMLSLNDSGYVSGKVSDKFSFDNIMSKIECLTHFPLPRFKSDGINIIVDNKAEIIDEDIVSWKKSNGYIGHANDLLTHKGFRMYTVTLDKTFDIDVYIVHMDADFYDPNSCPDVEKDIETRKSQFEQLCEYIKNRKNFGYPSIILGDTNSYSKYTWDKQNVNTFINSINDIIELEAKEAKPENFSDCDRIFYINNSLTNYRIELEDCEFDLECEGLSDHKPLIANFNIDFI